jgi:predicted nucleic acid-binding protein
LIDAVAAADRIFVEQVDADTEAAALEWRRVRDEHSIVDATSFATTPTRRIHHAFPIDADFANAEFVELRP